MGEDTTGKINVILSIIISEIVVFSLNIINIFAHCTRRGFGGGAMRSRDNRDNDRRRPY